MTDQLRVTTADGLSLVAQAEGDEAALKVVLIGGTAQVASLWAGVAAGLADSYRIITFDGRDVGDSDRASTSYSTDTLAADAIAVLDAFGGGAAAFAGISLGGCVALQVARLYPERVWAVATGSCWARTDQHLQNQFKFWIDLNENHGFGLVFRLMSFMAFSVETQQVMGDMSGLAAAVEAGTDADAFRRQVEADLSHNLTDDELAEIRAPLLAMWGDQDLIVPRRYAEQLAAAVPNAELVGLAPVSHSMMVDHPEQFIGNVRSWLDKHRDASPVVSDTGV
ncbi:alpha/beta hydrolase [Mycolicibacterium pulveris]|uniref:Pimeloyl-[acyl-carrier protein] methyl ester esterase n=1 Tax=Mycolicibacterium pulveris TaxID=36813 RepID=A0A7I7UPT8_MYCPV|nr:alpha/beta hydrolase [Mycolicibacterium pulveris]MCV6983529.1 alpha/beta hydrolase [Mycolicibacterium pulveris]BBY83408.1 pimeloyl-[acyl-carrier protein] methyl ester esterase [Mycolicibacterium pulveris]